MPAAVSQATLIRKLIERTGFGRIFPGIDPDNVAGTSFTLADSFGAAPTTGAEIPVKSQVIFLSPADSGTATASSATTVTDSTKSWTTNEWAGFRLSIDGWRVRIASNTATALTFGSIDEAPALTTYSLEYGDTYVERYAPTTGIVSLEPDLGSLNSAQTNTFTAAIFKDFDHAKQLVDSVNRALENRCWRKTMRPLTFLPDGDLQGTTVADYWTGTAATPAYISAQVFPAGGAVDAFGSVGLNRVLQSTTTNATNAVVSNGIKTVANPTPAGQQWFIQTAIRVVSGTGDVQLVVRDVTNSANITLQVIHGSMSMTAVTTSADFMYVDATFLLPANCLEFNVQLVSSATATVVQMAPVILYPSSAMRWPLPNRISRIDDIGNFFYARPGGAPDGLAAVAFSDAISQAGYTHWFTDHGDHLTVTFNFMPQNYPIYFEEAVYGTPLVGMADTTTFEEDYVIRWATYEMYDFLMRRELQKQANSESPPPSAYRHLRNSALRAAESFDPDQMFVYGRR